ncbi:MAG: hypothetical protein IJ418_04445 [Clostridia bacterium]|nr:hypothetical protein [Clostridia bacterium]
MNQFENFERQLYLVSSHLRTLEQYYGSSYSDAQQKTLIKEFMHATAETIDAMALTVDAMFREQHKEIEELRTMVIAS